MPRAVFLPLSEAQPPPLPFVAWQRVKSARDVDRPLVEDARRVYDARAASPSSRVALISPDPIVSAVSAEPL